MKDYFKSLSAEEKTLIEETAFPDWLPPMLATLTDKRFSDPKWLYECKFDGERALIYFNQGDVKIYSRNQHLLNMTYPELMAPLQKQNSKNFIIDGEIVAFVEDVTSFSQLQHRMGRKAISLKEVLNIPVFFYAFDILFLNGFDLRQLPLNSRKKLLKAAINFKNPLRLTESIVEKGEIAFKHACKIGWEGIIAKRADASYQGRRSRDWLKFKCHRGQELIIIGYTAPKGHRQGFGALLVGYYNKNKELLYAGKVGTGFSEQMLALLKKKMDQHLVSSAPIKEIIREKDVTWLKPILVGEFAFTEWTNTGKLRHPRFKGLREDKKAASIIRETPK